MWVKKSKVSSGQVGAKIYDMHNRLLATVPPRKFSLQNLPSRMAFSFAPKGLSPGVFRIDVQWDGQAVWRTFFRITD
jgi:hypothetical protein